MPSPTPSIIDRRAHSELAVTEGLITTSAWRPRPGLSGNLSLKCAVAGAAAAAWMAAPALAGEQFLNGHTFTLPNGFSVELAAGSALVPRPLAGSFDDAGRLYVTDSSGSNQPPAEQLKDPQSRILCLEDPDGDGRYDKVSVFADKVMFPQGCLWHDGSVYVAGPPSIWKFTDTDGDGKADQRTEWYQGGILTGCANDVHGPYLGPEGKLYWTKGAFGRLHLKDAKGRPIEDRCAHIFRAWPDGSGLESVISGGMDNPVQIAFTAHGEPVVISTFIDLSQPGRRDGLAHAVYGGVFGKRNDVVDEPGVRRTGDLMPAMTQFGPAAACAVTRYQGHGFGPAYRDNLFATLFNLRKVTRHELKPVGATFTTVDSDFLVSDQTDFHPTDVFEDVDGSMLVIDTGGWYKLCCPSSQLAKADVLGGIYRIRRNGSSTPPAEKRREGYARLIAPPRVDPSGEEGVLKLAALAAKSESIPRFLEVLEAHAGKASESDASARLARLAAEGLGRIGDRAAVGALFEAIGSLAASDRFLDHSLLYALIEIGNVESTRPFLRSASPAIRRAALLILEQIGTPPAIDVTDVVSALNSPPGLLRDAALWVARRHPEWGTALAAHFRAQLASPEGVDAEKVSWESMLDLLTRNGEGQALLADLVIQPGYREQSRTAALLAMAQSGLKPIPPLWRDAMLAGLQLQGTDGVRPAIVGAALRGLRALPFPKEGDPAITERLRGVAAHPGVPAEVRIEALGALPPGSSLNEAELALLLEALLPGRPPGERLSAASAIPRFSLSPSQRGSLIPAVAKAGPIELPRLITAFSPGGDAALGERFVAALRNSKALRSLRPEDLEPVLARFPSETRSAALAVITAAQTDASQDRLRLDTLLAEVLALKGEVRRGQSIFNGTKAACASCHRIGYLGGDLGPDLTSIGTSRTERDLLEAVLYPSASFVRSYEPWIASSRDGEEYSGVLRRDTPDEIVLATGPGAESRIPRSNLTELRLGNVSTMPAGLEEQLSKQDLADLLAFLKNTKWGAN